MVRICVLAVAGSAATTMALVCQRIVEADPTADIVVLDTEAFNTKLHSELRWTGPGEVVLTCPEDFGLRNFTKGTSRASGLNLVLNGGQIGFRRFVGRAKQMLQRLQPSVLLTCNDTFYGQRGFLKAAHEVGIPTILIQEGPLSIVRAAVNPARVTFKKRLANVVRALGLFPPSLPYGAYHHRLLLACSEAYAERFARAGVDPARIHVAGVPRFDELLSIARSSPSGLPRVLYVAQPFVRQGRVSREAAESVLLTIADALNQAYAVRPFELLLRGHPRSDIERLTFLQERLRIPFVASPADPLPQVVRSCDVTIGHYSIALLESIILGVPVLSFPIPANAFIAPEEAAKQIWFERIGVPSARSSADGAAHLLRLLSEDDAPQIDISEEVGAIDGRASHRAAEAVLRIASLRGDGRAALGG